MEKFDYKNAKIAVVDDDLDILESYKTSFEIMGMKVITFSNSVEALEWLNINDVDVILLDYYMNEINGDQFAEGYKGSAVTILQTGWAKDLPANQMIDMLNIQGYFNKEQRFDDLVVLVKSAIKTSALYKRINMLTYEKEFISNLLVNVTDETKGQVMALAGQKHIIEKRADELNDDILKEVAVSIGDSLGKINHTFKSLNFNIQETNISNLAYVFDIVKTLTLAKASVNFKLENDDFIPINCKGSLLVYILSEIAMYLYNSNITQTEIIGRKLQNCVSILINKPFNYSNEIIEKINNMAISEKNINISINPDNLLEISIS